MAEDKVGVGTVVRALPPLLLVARLAGVGIPDVHEVARRLAEAGGGYEIVHESPGLEVGVYVLVAPEPDRQKPHDDDELYFVLEGSGTLDVEGEPLPVDEGRAVFVPAGVEHRFAGYETMSLLVVFTRPRRESD